MSETKVIGSFEGIVQYYGYGCFLEVDLPKEYARKVVFCEGFLNGSRVCRGWYIVSHTGKLHIEMPCYLKGKRISLIIKHVHNERW